MNDYERGYRQCMRDLRMEIGLSKLVGKARITVEEVCNYFSTSESALVMKSRKEEIKYPRQVLTYFLMKETKIGSAAVGRLFDQDHTTVLHNVKKIGDLMSYDSTVIHDIESLAKRINEQHNSLQKLTA